MKFSKLSKQTLTGAIAATLLAGCSAGASSALGSPGLVPAGPAQAARVALPQKRAHESTHSGARPDRCAGNALYISDYLNSVIDSFGASGGSVACTVTPTGLSYPIGIWVQPVAGTYQNDLFAANSGDGMAVAFKTPLTSSSAPMWQFKVGYAASDVVQDLRGNVYVAVLGTPNIDVFTPPFDSCSYPNACAPSFSIIDPCGTVYWLATDAKGDVYSNNYCGYVTVFLPPIASGEVGTVLSGISYGSPGGMIVDKKNELVVNDPGYSKINVYGLNPLRGEAGFRFGLAPYSGQMFGIGLDKSNTFLWGAAAWAENGQRYSFTGGGTGGTPTASDPTIVEPMGAAARPSSAE